MAENVKIFYVGTKKVKRDSIAQTGCVWVGPGSYNEVNNQAAQRLLQYPDVWVDEKTFQAMEGGTDSLANRIIASDVQAKLDEQEAVLVELYGSITVVTGIHAALLAALNDIGAVDDVVFDPRIVDPLANIRDCVNELGRVLNPAEVIDPEDAPPSLRDASAPTAKTELTEEKLQEALIGIMKNLPADAWNQNGTPSIEAVREQVKRQIGDIEITTKVLRPAHEAYKLQEAAAGDAE